VISALAVSRHAISLPPSASPHHHAQAGACIAISLIGPVAFRLGLSEGDAVSADLRRLADLASSPGGVVSEAAAMGVGLMVGGAR
jgi:hypothetical protein